MEAYRIKALAYQHQARIMFVENTELIRAVCGQPGMNPVLSTALARTVSAMSLVAGTLKDNQRVNLKVKAARRDFVIYADADSAGHVSGYVSEEWLRASMEDRDRRTIEQWLGARACMQVTKDIGMNRSFTGITDMPYANIVDDLSHYYRQSEQTPTLFSLDVVLGDRDEVSSSRGLMAQLLPGAPSGLLDRIGGAISRHRRLLEEAPSREAAETVLASMFEDVCLVGVEPVRLFCGCSKELVYPLLYALDKAEVVDARESGRPLEIVCHKCGRKYTFQPDELANL